jgi:hypothetical protein
MKKQAPTHAKLELVRFTVARLNDISKGNSNKNFIDSDTTVSTLLCRSVMI